MQAKTRTFHRNTISYEKNTNYKDERNDVIRLCLNRFKKKVSSDFLFKITITTFIYFLNRF